MDQRCPQCLKTYGAEARFCPIDGTPLVAMTHSDPVLGTKLDGRYLLTGRLGEGAMGVVYEGIQLSIERPVAIKLLHGVPGDSHRRRQRFWMEARSVSRLEHPNVVRIYDFGTTENDVPYLVMELLKGCVLKDAMDGGAEVWEPRRAAQLIRGVALGLAVAHAMGLVHRDIKPGNIWLSPSSEGQAGESVKVIDFGLVKDNALDAHMTRTGMVMGTPAYMAPEQIEGRQDIGPTADVYALGVLLYELVVGEWPYIGDTYIELMTRHLSAPIPTPQKTTEGGVIPEALRGIWERALQKDPQARFADAQQLGDAIVATGILDDYTETTELNPIAVTKSRRDDAAATIADTIHVSTLQTFVSQAHQRKHVALLSVTIAEEPGESPLDMEERLERLTPLLEDWQQVCQNFGGSCTINPGVGVQAIFGLPVAAQDDAERAMEAAMVIHEKAQRGFKATGLCVRIGLDTDSVLAQIRSDSFAVVGTPFSVPERAASIGAPSGGLPVLTGAAYRRLRRSLRGELTTTTQVESEAYHQLASRAHFDSGSRVAVSVPSRMVGRDGELEQIIEWLSETLDTYGVNEHLVVGAPGVGKSRFLLGLEERIKQDFPEMVVLRGGPDELREVPGSLLRTLLRRGAGHPREDALLALQQWVNTSLTQYASRVEPEMVSMILSLAGFQPIPPDAEPRNWRSQAIRAMADFFGSLAIQGGLVLLLDDFDRSDKESLQVLAQLRDELAEFPVAIVATGRPESELEAKYLCICRLRSLGEEDAITLISQLDTEGQVALEARQRIVTQAEGNPLFIEELVWAARTATFDDANGQFPDTLQGVLQARLDALEPVERTVLQMASIVGATFWTGAVVAQAETAVAPEIPKSMAILEKKGLIQRHDGGLYRDEIEWAFCQPLMQEMLYASALKRQQRRGHGAVVSWFEALGDQVMPAHYPLIAKHCERAQRPSDAADAWRRAASAAAGRYANQEAITNYDRALELQVDWDTNEVAEVQVALGVLTYRLGLYPKASAHLNSVLTSDASDPVVRIKAQRFLGRIAGVNGDTGLQLELYGQALEQSEGKDLGERLACVADYAFGLSRGSESHLAMPLIDKEIASLGETVLSPVVLGQLANLYLVKCIISRDAGNLEQAEEAARAGLEACDRAGSSIERATILTSLSKCLRDKGEWEEAARCAADAADLFRLSGANIHVVTALLNQGWCLLDGSQALLPNSIFVRTHEQYNAKLEASWALRVYYLSGAAMAASGVGHFDRATALADQALSETEASLATEYRGWALYAAGVVRADVSLLDEAVQLWSNLGRPLWVKRVQTAIAAVS